MNIVHATRINGHRVCHIITIFCGINVFVCRNEYWDCEDDDSDEENMPVKSNIDTCS